jgi:hypothetical protein
MTSKHGPKPTPSESTLSAGDSPARTSAQPARAQGCQESDRAFSSSSCESFATWNPDTCSWRTSQLCLDGGWIPYSESWPRSGLMQSGIASRLPVLVHRTAGTGSSSSDTAPRLWPTPTVQDAGKATKKWRENHQNNLTAAVFNPHRLWPTPTATDHKGSGQTGTMRDRLDYAAERPQGERISGQLNPQWVEWLMGFPAAWTDLEG